jgi:hypothetical protein
MNQTEVFLTTFSIDSNAKRYQNPESYWFEDDACGQMEAKMS